MKNGRPPHEPSEKSRAQVKTLAAMGITPPDICKVLDLSHPTLRKHYKRELQTGQIEANAKVAGQLFKLATDSVKPNVTAMIFWLKTQAGWREADTLPRFVEEVKPPRLGKKEEANRNATTAQIGTTWEALLAPDPRRLPN